MPLSLLLSLSRKNLPGVPSRDSNSGLPCSRPACYQLSYAAPSPPSPHSHLLFAYYILQGILHNTYIGIYMRILYVHGWYIKQEVFSLWRLNLTAPCVCMWQLTGQPAPPPTSHMMWDSRHLCPLPTHYPPPPTASYVVEVHNSPPFLPPLPAFCLHITY